MAACVRSSRTQSVSEGGGRPRTTPPGATRLGTAVAVSPTVWSLEKAVAAVTRSPVRDTFAACWPSIRPLLQRGSVPRLQVVACDVARQTITGTLSIEAAIGTVTPAVIGSHSLCDLHFDGEPFLAARHLMVLVSPLRAGSNGPEFTFRVLDLRTRRGFADEEGRSLRSITADGTAFVVIGSHLVCFIVTSDGEYWPDEGADAWSCVPERVYLDEQLATSSATRQRIAKTWADSRNVTTVRLHRPSRLLGPQTEIESVVGHLTLVSGHGSPVCAPIIVVPVSARHTADGALLGRLDGADLDWQSLRHPMISRGHILLVSIDESLLAIDVASTNGLFTVGDGEVKRRRCLELGDGTAFSLGPNLVQAQWSIH